MKLTKTKLKQIIKEELENSVQERELSGENVWWINMTEDLLLKAQDMYRQAPPAGKEYMTKNFEMYAQKWREDMENSADDDYMEQ
jgi:hypothetical protein